MQENRYGDKMYVQLYIPAVLPFLCEHIMWSFLLMIFSINPWYKFDQLLCGYYICGSQTHWVSRTINFLYRTQTMGLLLNSLNFNLCSRTTRQMAEDHWRSPDHRLRLESRRLYTQNKYWESKYTSIRYIMKKGMQSNILLMAFCGY